MIELGISASSVVIRLRKIVELFDTLRCFRQSASFLYEIFTLTLVNIVHTRASEAFYNIETVKYTYI